MIEASEAHIESVGINLNSYLAPGDEHTVLTDGTFYTETVNGQSLTEWVDSLIHGAPVDDVHCVDCTTT